MSQASVDNRVPGGSGDKSNALPKWSELDPHLAGLALLAALERAENRDYHSTSVDLGGRTVRIGAKEPALSATVAVVSVVAL